METVTSSITTALTGIQGDVVTMLGAVLGVGVAIFGIKFAATQGIGFFKKVSK